jgi:cleavage and polyadenylation specificity factor subunit 1
MDVTRTQGEALEALSGCAGGAGSAAAVGNSYVLNLHRMMGIREVRDAVFLHGYTEPVLLLLHEPDPTWAGRLR